MLFAFEVTLPHCVCYLVRECFTDIGKELDNHNELIKTKMLELNHFKFKHAYSPDQIDLNPRMNWESAGNKQILLQKLARLDELGSQISYRKAGTSYLRDMYMADLKKTAEKYFI